MMIATDQDLEQFRSLLPGWGIENLTTDEDEIFISISEQNGHQAYTVWKIDDATFTGHHSLDGIPKLGSFKSISEMVKNDAAKRNKKAGRLPPQ